MDWTYTRNAELARAATRLYEQRNMMCRVSSYILMSDPDRTADLQSIASTLPRGATLIYRHFGAEDRVTQAQKLRKITALHDVQFLIGKDAKLAQSVGADGVHLPEANLGEGIGLRAKHPNWLITGAAHSRTALGQCVQANLDAALVSPVFPSQSPSAGKPLGVDEFRRLCAQFRIPVFALGGINAQNAHLLMGSGAAGIAGVSGFAHTISHGDAKSGYNVEILSPEFIAEMTALHAQGFDNSWPQDDFQAHIHNKHDVVIGITEQGKLLAFAILRTADEQAEILTIVVGNTHREKGLAQRLLQWGERYLLGRGVGTIFLEVAIDNVAAIHLYERLGYQKYAKRPRYYRRTVNGRQGRVDALLYQKHLA